MRDRLIELLKAADKYASGVCTDYDEAQEVCADFLLAEGIIVPPCKAGDKAYHLTSIDTLDELNVAEIFEGRVFTVSIEDKLWIFCRYDNGLNYWYTERDIGKQLFFAREEAEQALAERSEK